MKYLCLIYADERRMQELSAADHARVERACVAYETELKDSGQLLAGEALQPVHDATTVRVRDGRAVITDGPFAETREQPAGFYLVEARDLNDAILVAARIPPARLGSIEVRPIRELDPAHG
jgi:hypothetical protein